MGASACIASTTSRTSSRVMPARQPVANDGVTR